MVDYIKTYQKWLEKVDDKKIKSELESIKNDSKEIENRFYKELEFGTGGLRGILGAGTNYLNIYTIRKATQGLANYLKHIDGKSVAISYDSRINSDLFAENAAMIFAENGIKCYITSELTPTPFLSFLVRELNTDAGVMVTASHNPAKYNGYKVYGNDGCQITDHFADMVIKEIAGVDAFSIKLKSMKEYIDSGFIEYIDYKTDESLGKNSSSITEKYIQHVLSQRNNSCSDLKITYTPLNGTGYKFVPEVLKRCGFNNVNIVKEQGYPDGNFTTCSYPNPEKCEALKLGLRDAEKYDSDLLLATDPDADRVGIAIKTNGGYKLLSGNEVGVLLTDYILKSRQSKKTLPKNPIVIKTIVTTSLLNAVAKEYDTEVIEVLTGFKYIGEQIAILEKKGETERFIFGFEESYGYLSGSYVRDKDAVVASMLIAEMTAFYLSQGKTLLDVLNEIYQKYGKYSHKLVSKEFSGASGNKKIQELLSNLRALDIKNVNGLKVAKTTDYLTQTERALPKANVLVYDLEDNAQLIVRPSGTEPLIKFYLTSALTDEENQIVFDKMNNFIETQFS